MRYTFDVGDKVSDRKFTAHRRKGTVTGWEIVSRRRRYWVDWNNGGNGVYWYADLRRGW